MKLVLEGIAPAGTGCGEQDPAVATGGQQISPVLITMEVIGASACPGHGCGHEQPLDKHRPEQEKHQPARDLRPKRDKGAHGCSVCIYVYLYLYI